MACVKQEVMLAEGYDQFSFEMYESLLVGILDFHLLCVLLNM